MTPGGPEGGVSHTTGPITTPSSEMSDVWRKTFQALLEQANVPSAWVWEPSPLITRKEAMITQGWPTGSEHMLYVGPLCLFPHLPLGSPSGEEDCHPPFD